MPLLFLLWLALIHGTEGQFLTEGDIYVKGQHEGADGAMDSALSAAMSKWDDGIVNVVLSKKFTNKELHKILAAMGEIETKTCVHYKTPDTDDYVFINKNDYGCYSEVGKQGGKQLLNLASNCLTRRIILHEIMHTLGFVHEQTRPDRDYYVSINWNNIHEEMASIFLKRKTSELDLFTEYAFDSIMHYRPYDFALYRNYPTIIPRWRGVKLGGGERLSDVDVYRINQRFCTSDYEDNYIDIDDDNTYDDNTVY